jgi:hypothetical protein
LEREFWILAVSRPRAVRLNQSHKFKIIIDCS